MKYFRIKIYLKIIVFFKSLIKNNYDQKKIDQIILSSSKKSYVTYTSQLRSGFLLVLLYLKSKYKDKNEIIMLSYNLKEMVNIARQLNLKLVFCDISLTNGSYELSDLKKKINKKTLCVVQTNIFCNFNICLKIKKLCNKKKITLIEDNAIYFDNFSQNNKKVLAGSFGDYCLMSFNIMKNISGLYGGCVSFNDKNFLNFGKKQFKKNLKFPKILYFRQILIFFILKILSIKFLYSLIFKFFFYFAAKYNIKFIQNLVYPSLRFKNSKIPYYYISEIPNFSKKLIYHQLVDKNQRKKNHSIRKRNNQYYYKQFKKLRINKVNLLKVVDFNFQNFLDFPILIKDRDELHNFLLSKGYDTKKVHYFDCSIMFKFKNKFPISNKFQNEVLCLPNHDRISFNYIENLIKEIQKFYEKKF